jgi:NMD protein affecting ribosome stability and mRNA decay
VESQVKTKQLENPSVMARALKPTKSGTVFELLVWGTLNGEKVELRKEVEVVFKPKQCLVCARKQSKYYKAIIQLRNKNSSTPKNAVQKAFHAARNKSRELAVNDRDAEIFKFQKTKHGVNVYLGSLRVAKQVVNTLSSTFDADVQKSSSLFGMDKDGKKDIRVTYSVRL